MYIISQYCYYVVNKMLIIENSSIFMNLSVFEETPIEPYLPSVPFII